MGLSAVEAAGYDDGCEQYRHVSMIALDLHIIQFHALFLIYWIFPLQCPNLISFNSYTKYSGTSLLRTLCDLNFSPYYRDVLNLEVIQYTIVLHWDTEWCPYYRGSSIQGSFSTLQYYTGTQNGVLITEVSSIQGSFNTLQYYTGTEWCPYYRGFCNSEVRNKEVPLYYI